MNNLFGIVIGLLLLSLMLFLHELGHYLTGKRLGFKIVAFNIFMGPLVYSYYRNGVRYCLRAIPLGASVEFAGQDEEEAVLMPDDAEGPSRGSAYPGRVTNPWGQKNSAAVSGTNDPRLFYNRPKLQRAAVLLAGPLTNILSGVLAFLLLFSSAGYVTPRVAQVSSGSMAEAAGLGQGDTILSINGARIDTNLDLNFVLLFAPAERPLQLRYRSAASELRETELVPKTLSRYGLGITRDVSQPRVKVLSVDPASNGGQPVLQAGDILIKIDGQAVENGTVGNYLPQDGRTSKLKLLVERGGQTVELETSLMRIEYAAPLGLELTREYGLAGALPYSFQYSYSLLRMTFVSLGKLFVGELAPKDALSGPVGIVDNISGLVTTNQYSLIEKIQQLLMLFAFISLSLGVMNLLPIPLLDGSHLLLLLLERLRGKRLSRRSQTAISFVGLAMIVALFALGLYFDISRIVSR